MFLLRTGRLADRLDVEQDDGGRVGSARGAAVAVDAGRVLEGDDVVDRVPEAVGDPFIQ